VTKRKTRRPARHVSNVALERPPRPPRHHQFLKLHQQELFVLSALPGWMFRLYAALVMFSDFRSGVGQVHYWQLIGAMKPIQASNGGPRHDEVSEWQVRDALLRFERARLMQRRTLDSERGGSIFFAVSKRTGNFAQPRVT
jgi:hypothetical protein